MKFGRSTFSLRTRRGSLIIEAVIATALLATAIVALGKLTSNAAAVNQQADHRLAATLAAENALQRLQNFPFESLPAESSSVAEAIEADSGLPRRNSCRDVQHGSARRAAHLGSSQSRRPCFGDPPRLAIQFNDDWPAKVGGRIDGFRRGGQRCVINRYLTVVNIAQETGPVRRS